ncbi:unnamed protein product [Moneuplotes crassus]|uniref:Uncharacterized protein n=1 Tax=Euplotes crassus TaxID=5936 RepID=A0AAD1XKM6_EUPCR|nr:unnamed protein product [Moneuplotes crassus]
MKRKDFIFVPNSKDTISSIFDTTAGTPKKRRGSQCYEKPKFPQFKKLWDDINKCKNESRRNLRQYISKQLTSSQSQIDFGACMRQDSKKRMVKKQINSKFQIRKPGGCVPIIRMTKSRNKIRRLFKTQSKSQFKTPKQMLKINLKTQIKNKPSEWYAPEWL